MNRNSENRFAINPTNLDIQRSRFSIPFQHKTTFNAADLIPIYCSEILPGDTVTMDMSAAVRMSTPIFPVMDNCNIDTYFYFVPNRILWDHWKEFMGENKLTAWEQPVEYEIPQIQAPAGGWEKGTIADHFGLPTKIENIEVSHLPFRAYCMIWNEWFRDQNLKDACMINTDETTLTGTNEGDYVSNAQLGAKPLKVAKYHDMFTSALPEPQKGPDVLLPIGNISGELPVVTNPTENQYKLSNPLMWETNGFELTNKARDLVVQTIGSAETNKYETYLGGSFDYVNDETREMYPTNLVAVANNISGASSTINALRQAFAIQRFYEKQARAGSRYRETIKNMFGVTTSDASMQIPEYLGGYRHPITIDQVLQTSETTETSPQGNVAAYSLTNFVDSVFTKSFDEHGWIIGVACIRTEHTYQQGINAMWSRKSLFDFYFPTFANLGEMPIYNKEIYAQGTAEDEEVFGYQEAWASYRYHPSIVTGAFRSNYDQTLDSWHYADYYTELPTLSSEWIDETKANINRTIAVQDQLEDQFIADFYFNAIYTRPMPLYSIPGLIDHN